MKKLTLLTFALALAFVVAGCETTKETNSNHAVVVNSNTTNMNATLNTNMANTNNVTGTGSVDFNSNISREEYDKHKDKYSTAAKSSGESIGQGLEDGWLWTKTKSALATTNDLRDSTINVDVDNGVITLRGTVATKAQLDSAAKVANGIEGKKSVKNELTVSAGDSMTNQMTTTNSNTHTSNANMKK